MKLLYSSAALWQLDDIAAFIAMDNPTVARSVLGRIRSSTELLAEFPMIGREGSIAETREWVVPGLPYVVVYKIDSPDDTILIVNVFHGAQDRP